MTNLLQRWRRPKGRSHRNLQIERLDEHLRADIGLPPLWDARSARHLPF